MYFAIILTILLSNTGLALDIPDEYRTVGGRGTALGHSATVANNGVSSVVLNPAMLAIDKDYQLSVGYSWPTSGREFYQLGVVDGKTSKVAAGILYTGFRESFDAGRFLHEELDAPIRRRGVLALAMAVGKMSLGLNGQYLEGYRFPDNVNGLLGLIDASHVYQSQEHEVVRGISAGLAIAAVLSPTLRVGASLNNLANRKVADFAPRTIRAGVAYVATAGGEVTVHADYLHRQRLALFGSKATQMATVSCSILVYDIIRVLAAYGQSLIDEQQELSAGLSLTNERMSISYGLRQPLPNNEEAMQQSVNLAVTVSI